MSAPVKPSVRAATPARSNAARSAGRPATWVSRMRARAAASGSFISSQSSTRPERDASAGGRCAGQVHGRHHDADARAASLLREFVEHGEQITVETALFAVFEDGVGIVDEDDRGRVLLGGFEDLVDAAVELAGASDESSVDQEELAFQAMRKRAADGGLAGAGRPVEEQVALGAQAESRSRARSLSSGRTMWISRLRMTSSTPWRSARLTFWTSPRSTLLARRWVRRRHSMKVSRVERTPERRARSSRP